jgi:hypothetical protein
MSLAYFATLLCLFVLALSKPLLEPIAARQDGTPTASPPAQSTACGDIIVATKNSELQW